MTHERRAVSIAFLAFGAVMGSWVPRLPALKDHLHISDAQVGYALLAVSLGAVIGAGVARVVLRRGARAWVRGGTIAICVSLVIPGLAGSFTQLLVSLLLLGACAGFIDMLENAQAADLERMAGRPLLNGFHGYWSLGAFGGAVLAGAAAFVGLSPLLHFALVAILAAVASAFFLRDLPNTSARRSATRSERRRPVLAHRIRGRRGGDLVLQHPGRGRHFGLEPAVPERAQPRRSRPRGCRGCSVRAGRDAGSFPCRPAHGAHQPGGRWRDSEE